jgi:outer membrane protein assembly factor BamB
MTASALSTAGGLVFGGTADRQFFALNTDNGELLWQTRLNGDVSGAPVSYEIDGKQYVAIASGGRAAPTTTLGRLVGVDVPQGSGVMWVFALPDDEPREVPRPTRRDQPQRSLADGVFTAGQAAQGEQLFEQECRAWLTDPRAVSIRASSRMRSMAVLKGQRINRRGRDGTPDRG